jgi:hypothetical protein
MKPAKLSKPDRETNRAMLGYLSLFANLDDAQAFQKAAHATDVKHLPPCVRVVRDGGAPSAIYWRWLAAQAEAWS